MTIAVIAGVCVVLLILGFLVPRMSWWPQRGVDRALGAGRRGVSEAPGPLGRWLPKPLRISERAADKSAATGRRGRAKMPF